MKTKMRKIQFSAITVAVCAFLFLFINNVFSNYPGNEVCVIKDKKGNVIFSCEKVPNESCSKTYLGYTLTCNDAKEKENGE